MSRTAPNERRTSAGANVFPATDSQRQLWVASALAPPGAYTMPIAWQLHGDVDWAAFERAIADVHARHPALRTRLHNVDGKVCQIVDDSAAAMRGPRLEHRVVANLQELHDERHRIASTHLDVEHGPTYAVRLLSAPGQPCELHLVLHHALGDEASLNIWITDLLTCYQRQLGTSCAELAPLTTTLADVARSQETPAHQAHVRECLTYWRDHLADAPPVLELPRRSATDQAPDTDDTVGNLLTPLPEDVTAALRTLRERGLSSFQAIVAATGLVLSRYSDQEDLVIGTAMSGRLDPAVDGVIGMFANTVALRLRPDAGLDAVTYARHCQEVVMDALDYSDASMELVVDVVRPVRTQHHPIFQVMLAYNRESAVIETSDEALRAVPIYVEPATARFDLSLFAIERNDGSLTIRADYPRAVLDDVVVSGIVAAIGTALTLLADHPNQRLGALRWVPEDKQAPGGPSASREVEWDDHFVMQRILSWAEESPSALAIVGADGNAMTYQELRYAVREMTERLSTAGIGINDVVALELADPTQMVLALLAVQQCGAVWMPLDHEAPDSYRERLVHLVDARAVIDSTGTVRTRAQGGERPPLPKDACYIYATSGSTGEPKPVLIGMRALVNLTQAFIERHGFGADDVILALPPLHFDAAVGDVFPALMSGATLVLHDDPAAVDWTELVAISHRWGVTSIDAPSALWQQWCDELESSTSSLPGTVTRMMVGGEAVPRARVHQWHEATPSIRLFNHYGPTEATVCATVHEVGAGISEADFGERGLAMGTPLPGVEVVVLNRHHQPVPDGVPGEVVIGGAGVAYGYLGTSGLHDGGRFVGDPADGTTSDQRPRRYHTGDYAIRAESGLLHFVGRRDNQVKISGRRIELGDVETALLAHPDVALAAVSAPSDHRGELRLVAYVQRTAGRPGESDQPDDPTSLGGALREFVARRLPGHLVPSHVVVLDQLPLTTRGKVDRNRLPTLDWGQIHRPDIDPPHGDFELAVADLWRRELGVQQVGRSERFVELGGSSLGAARVVGAIDATFGVKVAIREVLELDLAAVASLVEEARGSRPSAEQPEQPRSEDPERLARADLRLLDDTEVGPVRRGRPRRILVTGANGFLGTHLLTALAHHGAEHLVAVVRADSDAHALARLQSALSDYHLDPTDQLTCLAGDLDASKAHSGAIDWTALVADVDAVVNVAGLVRPGAAYADHRAPNVAGAASLAAAAAARGVPIHQVSTLGVFWSAPYAGRRVTEKDKPSAGFPQDGYNQSKWVSDQLFTQLADRGAAAVHRPGRLSCAWTSPAHLSGSWWGGMLTICRELRLVPDLTTSEDLMPVDWMADALARLVMAGRTGSPLHYWNADTVSYAQIAQALDRVAPGTRLVSYRTWHQRVFDAVREGKGQSFAPFVSGLASPEQQLSTRPSFPMDHTMPTLAQLGVSPPPTATDLLDREIDILTTSAKQEA